MLGLNMTSLALPDYEIIKCLERLIHLHQHHFVTCACLKDVTLGWDRHPQSHLKLLHWIPCLLREVELSDGTQFSISRIPETFEIWSVCEYHILWIERGSVICKKRISEVPAEGKCLTLKTPIVLFASTLGPRRVPVDCKPRVGNGGREFTFMGFLLWLGSFPTQFNSHNSHVEKV